jgi:membrane-associated phospholipid phosphatase
LQRNEVLNTNISERTDFTDKMVFSTYRTSAPYGESPSGHWGNSILFILATRPIFCSKKIKTQSVVFSLWTIFAIFVCASTLLLKQHNIIDGFNTIALIAII